MPFVIDASVVLAWHFKDERWPHADDLGREAIRAGVVVPAYFRTEVASGLLRGEREKRTDRQSTDRFMRGLDLFQIEEDGMPEAQAWSHVLPLAREQDLKMFDAGYLHLAIRRDLPLATFDARLARAAMAVGTALLKGSQ